MTKPKVTKQAAKPSRTMTINATAPSESRAETISKLSADGMLPLTLTAHMFARGLAGDELDVTAMHARMTGTAKDAASGDLQTLERMLSGQAQTLNMMFTELARRAALNMGQHMQAAEMYLRMAFKAQAQSRATVDALAEMKNPRAVAFVKQANIAQQQQVNNGTPALHAHARERAKPENELLEDATHEQQQRMVPGAQAAPARGNPAMETVGAVNRAEDARGEGHGSAQ